MNPFRRAVEDYLALRRSLGFKLRDYAGRSTVGGRDMAVAGDYLYLPTEQGLEIWNVAPSTKPERVGVTASGPARSVALAGYYALVACEGLGEIRRNGFERFHFARGHILHLLRVLVYRPIIVFTK